MTNEKQGRVLLIVVWVTLSMLIVLVMAARIRLLGVPLERDEGEYAYAGQLILRGLPPYEHVYNMKLPGTYAAYAVIIRLFGSSHIGIHVGLLIVNVVTGFLLLVGISFGAKLGFFGTNRTDALTQRTESQD